MKIKHIPSSWLHRNGRRFDCGPYTSGALEARIRLEDLSYPKQKLSELTAGHNGGIYNGPQFVRNFVSDPTFGVPFLGTSSMLRSDLSDLPLLRKQDALSSKLAYLRVRPGMTLISCSGTIGRMVYARPDMDGVWSNQDILKVVPDPSKIPAGYVFALLSSKFGVPIVTSGTYGAIIQHIEPEHIAGLPVPRMGETVEEEAHRLVDGAAHKRSEAVRLLHQSQKLVDKLLGSRSSGRTNCMTVSSLQLQSRFDAYYYSSVCTDARRRFDTADTSDHKLLQDVAKVFIPGIFKRKYADDPKFGRPYITGADVFQLSPTSDQYLMTRVVSEYQLAVTKGTILIQEAGQLGGLIGRGVMVGDYLDGFAVSNNMVRLTAYEKEDAGYLFALLSTDEGVTLIAREAAGSSIPHMDAGRLSRLRIPWPAAEVRRSIGRLVDEAIRLRDEACVDEKAARTLVEKTIEAAS